MIITPPHPILDAAQFFRRHRMLEDVYIMVKLLSVINS